MNCLYTSDQQPIDSFSQSCPVTYPTLFFPLLIHFLDSRFPLGIILYIQRPARDDTSGKDTESQWPLKTGSFAE